MPEPQTSATSGAAAKTADAEPASTLGHAYDGIQEYDNPTPAWWSALFLLSVIFAPLYVFWFHSPQTERSHAAQYERALAANLKLQFGELGDLVADEETILRFIDNPKWLKVGKAAFTTNCASCHGKNGEGLNAPNLTDDYYLHVKSATDIATVIANGANNLAMPAWGGRLHPTEVVLVASYVASMRGENLESRRGPEGDAIAPWPDAS
ncbi:MAG: cbb3-type cytochrome c oxidase N-terminal domain-containing protein [Planctomycetota bacterium]